MVREIIYPANSSIVLHLPEDMIGKTIEVIAFTIDDNAEAATKGQRLVRIQQLTEKTLTDLNGFTFNRDEANSYDE